MSTLLSEVQNLLSTRYPGLSITQNVTVNQVTALKSIFQNSALIFVTKSVFWKQVATCLRYFSLTIQAHYILPAAIKQAMYNLTLTRHVEYSINELIFHLLLNVTK